MNNKSSIIFVGTLISFSLHYCTASAQTLYGGYFSKTNAILGFGIEISSPINNNLALNLRTGEQWGTKSGYALQSFNIDLGLSYLTLRFSPKVFTDVSLLTTYTYQRSANRYDDRISGFNYGIRPMVSLNLITNYYNFSIYGSRPLLLKSSFLNSSYEIGIVIKAPGCKAAKV